VSEAPRPTPRWVRVGLGALTVTAFLVPAAIGLLITLGIAAGMTLSSIAGDDPTPAFVLGGLASVGAGAVAGVSVIRRSRAAPLERQRGRAAWGLGLLGVLIATAGIAIPITLSTAEDRYRTLPSAPGGLDSVDLPDDGRNLLALLRGRRLLDADHPEPEPPHPWEYSRTYYPGDAEFGDASLAVLAVNSAEGAFGKPPAFDGEDELTQLAEGSDLIALARDERGRIVYVEFTDSISFAEPTSDWLFTVGGGATAREALLTEIVDAMTEAGWTR